MRQKCCEWQEMSSLKIKFGGVVVLAMCWALLMMYLVNLLEWVPAPFAILQSEPAPTTPSAAAPTVAHAAPTVRSASTTSPRPLREEARVLIASDGSCLGGLVSAVNSILTHTKHAVKFYLVTTAEELSHLRSWIQATHLHRMHYELRTTKTGISRVKLRGPDIFPELNDRLVYLDCDVIVQGDVWELFSAHIAPGHVGAFPRSCIGPAYPPRVRNYLNLAHSGLNGSRIDPQACPLATGAFVANLTLWRRHDVTTRVLRWLDAHRRERIVGTHPGADPLDAAMLIVLHNVVTELEPSWHVQHLARYSKQFVEKAKLLHWSGRAKPWSHRVPHEDVWHRYYIPDPTAQYRPARKRV